MLYRVCRTYPTFRSNWVQTYARVEDTEWPASYLKSMLKAIEVSLGVGGVYFKLVLSSFL